MRPETMEIRFHALAFGGEAVGKDPEGRAVFCLYAAPMERSRVRLVERHKTWARAALERVLAPGPDRVEPRCRHFGSCGGCLWQHVSYACQLAAKKAIVEGAIRRIGIELEGPPPTDSPFGARRRVRMVARVGRLGYFGFRSHKFVAVEECPAMEPRLWEALRGAAPKRDGEVSALSGSNGVQILGAGLDRGESVDLAEPGEPAFRVPADAFAQASASGDRALRATVLEWAGRGTGAGSGPGGASEAAAVSAPPATFRILELFTGAGNFTRLLARDGAAVVAVEREPRPVEWLRKNSPSAEIDARDASAAVKAFQEAGRRFDAIVLDPPRGGCANLLADLAALAPARIVYVSCDPMTLARDLLALASLGYRTERLRAFDLMPQTPHVECVALLLPAAGAGPIA